MSHQDLKFVRALGISVAQLAEALAKSRQTVNRGIRADGDYLKQPDMVRALDTWRRSNPTLYQAAKTQICDIYPHIADEVLRAVGGGALSFSTEVPGEYWFVCGDFLGFKNGLPECAKQLEQICEVENTQVKVFLNERDFVHCARWKAKSNRRSVDILTCGEMDLRVMPSMLLRIDFDENMDLFGVSDAGFIALSRQEAARLRMALQDAGVAVQRVEGDLV